MSAVEKENLIIFFQQAGKIKLNALYCLFAEKFNSISPSSFGEIAEREKAHKKTWNPVGFIEGEKNVQRARFSPFTSPL